MMKELYIDLRSLCAQNRPVTRQVHPMILARRSLREMTGQSIKDEELMSLFEAARWAPSHFNTQTWRFVYAKRGSKYWDQYLDALSPGNRKWAKNAGVLMVVLSKLTNNYKGRKEPVPSHSFDTGSAWMAMALEGTARGLVVHAMGGFDPKKAADMIGLKSKEYRIEAMIAVGIRDKSVGPEKTTQRNEVEKFISEGIFTEKLK